MKQTFIIQITTRKDYESLLNFIDCD